MVYHLAMKAIGTTLIVVDMQYDFLEGGALAVAGATIEMAQKIERLSTLFDQVILTADDHPEDHISFETFAAHCVQNTEGAKLAITSRATVLYKGRNRETEEFSAFAQGRRINFIEGNDVYVCGVAGDYCVRQTIEDILQYAPEKRVFAIIDMIRSIDGLSYIDRDPFSGKVRFVTSEQVQKRIAFRQEE